MPLISRKIKKITKLIRTVRRFPPVETILTLRFLTLPQIVCRAYLLTVMFQALRNVLQTPLSKYFFQTEKHPAKSGGSSGESMAE